VFGVVVVVLSQRAAIQHGRRNEALSHVIRDDDAPAASRTVQIIRLMLSILLLAIYIVHSLTSDESLAPTHMS
jgi:hypothetical protein